MKRLLNIFFLTLLPGIVPGQIEGDISFISSQHYYVRFDNTSKFSEGDTLYSVNNNPVLVLKYISGRSCACLLFGDKDLTIGQKVYGRIKSGTDPDIIATAENPVNIQPKSVDPAASDKPFIRIEKNENSVKVDNSVISNLRLSVQNYSTYSNTSSDNQRSRYTLSGKLENLSNRFTLSTYLNYIKDEDFFRFSGKKRFNVYDLNINYHQGSSFNLWLGRYLNPKVSSLSTIDGLQAEKKMKNYFAGLLIGSRPDFSNMGYNIKLLEYGAYAGRTDTVAYGFMENTLAFFQQTNNSAIDRRFIYFQHRNNILTNLNLFLSSEIDLYAREKGKGLNKLSATSIFFSSRYSLDRAVSFSLSYDARKNVIYYETFRNFADSILDKETRQGIRFGINMRPFDGASFGINTGYRFKKSDIKPARNIGAHFSYSSIPLIRASGSANITKLITSYLDGLTYGINLSKQMFSNLSTTLTLRRVNYSFRHSDIQQNILSSDITIRLSKMFFLLAGYEVILEKRSTSQRILFDITARL